MPPMPTGRACDARVAMSGVASGTSAGSGARGSASPLCGLPLPAAAPALALALALDRGTAVRQSQCIRSRGRTSRALCD